MEVSINEILTVIRNDGVVAIPTDTVYGLVGNPFSEIAVNKVYDLKKRDKNKKLSIFLRSHAEIIDVCETIRSIENFIFKELGNNTIILKKKDKNYLNLVSNDTIGIRIPNNKYLLEILNNFSPLFATSINETGQEELLTYEDIYKNFNSKIDLIVKNDTVPLNKPSSIFTVTDDGKIEQIR